MLTRFTQCSMVASTANSFKWQTHRWQTHRWQTHRWQTHRWQTHRWQTRSWLAHSWQTRSWLAHSWLAHSPKAKIHWCCSWVICVAAAVALTLTADSALADPVWYTAGTGGFNPNIPDFYQHQNWIFNGPTAGWERGKDQKGWCFFVAFADVYYDLTKLGYKDLLTADITDGAKWFDTAYKPSDVPNSDLFKLEAAMVGKTVQAYLDSKNHKVDDVTAPLVSNSFKVDGSGMVTYTSPAPKKGAPDIVTTQSVFTFYNNKTKAGDELLLEILPGTVAAAAADKPGRWWAYHELAGAGLDVKTNTVFVTDPDSNKGSKLDTTDPAKNNAGWPDVAGFPGALKSANTDPIPIPAGPTIGTLNSYDTYYAGFTLSDKNKITGDANNGRYTGTVVDRVRTISAPKGKLAAADVVPGKGVQTTINVNSGVGTVDGVYIAPSSTVNSFSELRSFMSSGSTWMATSNEFDPFSNDRVFGGVEYDLLTGTGLMPGQIGVATLGTNGDFSLSGFEILLHFVGDPSNLWDPEVIGQVPDSFDLASDQSVVPEPSSFLLAGLGAVGLLSCGLLGCSGKRRPVSFGAVNA